MFFWRFCFGVALAQGGAADALAGGAGWVGAGLLGMVLGWLLIIHLPAKDRQIKDLLTDKDKQIDALLQHKWQAIQQMSADHLAAVKALAAEFRGVCQEMSRQSDREVERMCKLVETRQVRVDEYRQKLAEQQSRGQPRPRKGP